MHVKEDPKNRPRAKLSQIAVISVDNQRANCETGPYGTPKNLSSSWV